MNDHFWVNICFVIFNFVDFIAIKKILCAVLHLLIQTYCLNVFFIEIKSQKRTSLQNCNCVYSFPSNNKLVQSKVDAINSDCLNVLQRLNITTLLNCWMNLFLYGSIAECIPPCSHKIIFRFCVGLFACCRFDIKDCLSLKFTSNKFVGNDSHTHIHSNKYKNEGERTRWC